MPAEKQDWWQEAPVVCKGFYEAVVGGCTAQEKILLEGGQFNP